MTPETLRAKGLVHKHGLVKVLARGEINRPLTVRAHAFSAAAEQADRGGAGGTAETVERPGGRRPSARQGEPAHEPVDSGAVPAPPVRQPSPSGGS